MHEKNIRKTFCHSVLYMKNIGIFFFFFFFVSPGSRHDKKISWHFFFLHFKYFPENFYIYIFNNEKRKLKNLIEVITLFLIQFHTWYKYSPENTLHIWNNIWKLFFFFKSGFMQKWQPAGWRTHVHKSCFCGEITVPHSSFLIIPLIIHSNCTLASFNYM